MLVLFETAAGYAVFKVNLIGNLTLTEAGEFDKHDHILLLLVLSFMSHVIINYHNIYEAK